MLKHTVRRAALCTASLDKHFPSLVGISMGILMGIPMDMPMGIPMGICIGISMSIP